MNLGWWSVGEVNALSNILVEEKVKKFGEVQLCWDECADSHDVGKTRQQQGGGGTAQDF